MGKYSALEKAVMVLGHEQSHTMGIETGDLFRGVPHSHSNLNGYEKCLSVGMCGGLIVHKVNSQ